MSFVVKGSSKMSVQWEKSHVKSSLSSNAVQGGRDSDGSLIFVGRALHNGIFLPAKIIPSKNACYVSYNGGEVFVENFEVLIGERDFIWEPSSDGRVNPATVSTGRDGNDEIFIGRAPFQGSLTIGKVHPSHRCLYFPYNGREERTSTYEVLVHKKLSWVASSVRDLLPRDAVLGGRDTDGSLIYVGRATHEGAVLPCKVIPSKQAAYVSTHNKEILKQNYEILVGRGVVWKREKNGKVPKDALPGGRANNGEVLYIGRADYIGSLTIGKVHPSHKCMYFPYGGSEISLKEYEVLVPN